MASQFLSLYHISVCQVYDFLSSSGLLLMVNYILWNSYRLHKLFNAEDFQVLKITNADLYLRAAAVVSIHSILYLVWIGLTSYESGYCSSNDFIFISVAFLLRSVLMAASLACVIWTRRISSLQYNDFTTQSLSLYLIASTDTFNTVLSIALNVSSESMDFFFIIRSSIVLSLLCLTFGVATLPRIISAHVSQSLVQGRMLLLHTFDSVESLATFGSSAGNHSMVADIEQHSVEKNTVAEHSVEEMRLSSALQGRMKSPTRVARSELLAVTDQCQLKELFLSKLLYEELFDLQCEIIQNWQLLLGLQECISLSTDVATQKLQAAHEASSNS
eukprot:TRINITY_DN8720_c0_g1_i1.p1 TRINITY_DN8720_c0_g1~~TRINITY_DN8720_c0_g1_i1.p1  ORF type:complete len:365 (-),score=77.07 TRINITY_DN8720_c0_g1_i1:285-1277(-)